MSSNPFKNEIKNLTQVTDLSSVIQEFEDVNAIIIGEHHSKEHKDVLIDNGPVLKEMGYQTVFLEYRPTIQKFIEAVGFGFNGTCGNPNIDHIIYNLSAQKFKLICVDVEDLKVKGKFYRAEVQRFINSFDYDIRINSAKTIKSSILEAGVTDKQVLSQLDTDITHCFNIGPKSLQNLFVHFNVDPVANIFETQEKFLDQLKKMEDQRLEFSELFDGARNKVMVQNIQKHRKPGEKFISFNGLGHISAEVSAIKGDETLQALLSNKNLETLSVGISGGIPNEHYDPRSEKIWDADEVATMYAQNKSFAREFGPMDPTLREKLFYTDRYDENDLSHEDISLHLPETFYKFHYAL